MSRVQSIERTFAVLGTLADEPIGVSEVTERASLPKSTAARLLASPAPIADASGDVIAAVHLHGPSYRFPAPGTELAVAERVVATAAHIASSLREAG